MDFSKGDKTNRVVSIASERVKSCCCGGVPFQTMSQKAVSRHRNNHDNVDCAMDKNRAMSPVIQDYLPSFYDLARTSLQEAIRAVGSWVIQNKLDCHVCKSFNLMS